MTSVSSSVSPTEFEDLKSNFIICVSVFGGIGIFLVIAVGFLLIWSHQLTKKIKKLDPFVNFKLQRPKLITDEESPAPSSEHPRNVYDNPLYPRNYNSLPEKRDLNPIALRSKASVDNGNFSFGTPNNLSSNSFRSPDYLDQDSRFY